MGITSAQPDTHKACTLKCSPGLCCDKHVQVLRQCTQGSIQGLLLQRPQGDLESDTHQIYTCDVMPGGCAYRCTERVGFGGEDLGSLLWNPCLLETMDLVGTGAQQCVCIWYKTSFISCTHLKCTSVALLHLLIQWGFQKMKGSQAHPSPRPCTLCLDPHSYTHMSFLTRRPLGAEQVPWTRHQGLGD